MKVDSAIVKKLKEEEKLGILKSDSSLSLEYLIKDESENQIEFSNDSSNINQKHDLDILNQLEIVTESTSDLISIVSFSIDPKFEYVNLAHKRILGYADNDLVGRSLFDFIHPDDRKKIMVLLKKYISIKTKKIITGKSEELVEKINFRLKDKQGTWHYLESTANLVGNKIISISKDVTYKKDNTDRLNTILETVQAGIILIDPKKHEIVDVNKYALDMIGLDKDKIVGNKCYNFICPAEKGKCPITDLGKKVDKSEKKLIDKDRNEKSILKTVTPVIINDKELLLESFVDISQLKQIQIELDLSKKQAENILNAAADGIRIIDKNFKILKINDTFVEMAGISFQDQIGSRCKDIFRSNYCDTSECSLVKILKEGKAYQKEQIMVRPDGKKIPVLLKVTPFKDDQGNITGIIEDYRNISYIKEAESKLMENEKKFREFFETSPDYYYMISPKGIILDINQSALEILNIGSKEQIIGQKIIPTVYPVDSKKRADELVDKWQRAGKLRNEIINIKTMAGNRAVLLSVQDIKNIKGKLLYSILIQKDITVLKQAEELLKDKINDLEKAKKEIDDLNKNLEYNVEQRTVEIKKLLKQKDDFINQLGHDLKTPLTPITTLLPIVKKNINDAKMSEMLDIVIQNADYMKNLVIKTLQLARLNSPNLQLELEKLNLFEQVNKILNYKQYLFKSHGVKLKNKIDKSVYVNADKLRLAELFDNLISNCVKYSSKKNLLLILETTDRSDGFIEVIIKDNGIGMTSEQINNIFDEFYKSDPSRHDLESTGLGLSICKKVIRLHGGEIWAESKGINKGTTFHFTLQKSNKIIKSKTYLTK